MSSGARSSPNAAAVALIELLDQEAANRLRSRDVLTVIPVLEELALTLEEVAAGRPAPLDADRRSLVCDLDLALTRTGPSLQRATSPTLRSVRTDEVTRLGGIVADRAQSTQVASTIRGLLRQLETPAAVESAWDDAVAALANPATPLDECALAVAQVEELVSRRGQEWWAVRSRIAEHARNKDLDAARHAVAKPPPDDVVVAWVAIGNAHLGRGYVRVGKVQFFTGQLGLRDIRDGCPALDTPEFEPAVELSDRAIDVYFRNIEAEHYVLARVELGGCRAKTPPDGRRLPPVEWARKLVEDIIESASFRQQGTDWVVLEGGCYFTVGGNDGGTAGFDDPVKRAERAGATSPYIEPTGEALASLPGAYADALVSDEPAALAAAEAVRWHRDVQRITDPRMRIALHVRRFEVQWGTGDPSGWRTWEEPTRHFLRDLWCRTSQYGLLSWGGIHLHWDQRHAHPKSQVAAALGEIYLPGSGTAFRINRKAMLRWAPAVAKGFTAGTVQRRRYKELARRTHNGRAAQAWWRELRRRFDVLLNRAVRQRNRVIHGRQPVEAVLASVDEFVADLSATLAAEAVQGAAHGHDVAAVVERERQVLADRHDRIGTETSADALFGP
jgi:hypothetical protein